MDFSKEELDFFQDVFASNTTNVATLNENHALNVTTEIPKNVSNILGNAKLTLLAEISHYQLWFPLSLSINESGDFIPKLETPEVIDVQGIERSWRVIEPENVSVYKQGAKQAVDVVCLSSSGVTMKINNPQAADTLLENSDLEIHLPDQQAVKLNLESVRSNNNMFAAKFKNIEQGRDSLRKFLFNLHRDQFSDLYKNIS